METTMQDKMTIKQVKDLKAGELFKMRADGRKVYAFGLLRNWRYCKAYDRREGRYTATDAEDANREIYLKPTAKVFVGFTY